MLAESGIESVKLPPRSPNLNAYSERFVRTIKESCLERMILFGEDALRNAVGEFVAHYPMEWTDQSAVTRERRCNEVGRTALLAVRSYY
jgi:hypothetical protein